MIADWTVDIGTESPTIDIPWDGWVDLRASQSDEQRTRAVRSLAEAADYPEFIALLLSANSGHLFSSKVDIFPISRDEVDPEIAEAGEVETSFGLASYLDMVADEAGELFATFAQFEAVARLVAKNLGKIELPAPCAVEVVVRAARLFGRETFGWTLYAMAFGASESAARASWAATATSLSAQFHRVVAAQAADFSVRAPLGPSASVGE